MPQPNKTSISCIKIITVTVLLFLTHNVYSILPIGIKVSAGYPIFGKGNSGIIDLDLFGLRKHNQWNYGGSIGFMMKEVVKTEKYIIPSFVISYQYIFNPAYNFTFSGYAGYYINGENQNVMGKLQIDYSRFARYGIFIQQSLLIKDPNYFTVGLQYYF